MNHLLSIIVPVYNVESYLERCIESIINQTYKNLEIILVNDGSKDSSGEICELYAKKDNRITVYHQKNGGLSAARNTGLNNITGDFIAFIDSDDWIELDMCETMLRYSHENNLDIIECDIQYTSNNKITTKPKFIIENREEATIRILENRFFSVCRRIYKAKLLVDMRFKENYIYEDMMFTSKLLCSLTKIGYYNKPFYNYYIENTNSIMHGAYNIKNLKSIDAVLIFQENIKSCFDDKKIIKAAKEYILFFAAHHYQQLFLNKKFDNNSVHRKKLKNLIKTNYSSENKNSTYTKIARYSPMWVFNIFSKFIKLR